MKNSKLLAILNFVFVLVNLSWLIILDKDKFFGRSLNDVFTQELTYLTPHKYTYFIWTLIGIALTLLHFTYIRALDYDRFKEGWERKILRVGNLIIINQLLLGLSMVTKLNNYIGLSTLLSLGVLVTIIITTYRLDLFNNSNPCVIQYFTKIGYSLYAGWMIYVVGFNSKMYLSQVLELSYTSKFIFAIAFLAVVYAWLFFLTIKHRLPALLFGFTAGIVGSYFNQVHASNMAYNTEIRIIFGTLIAITCFTLIYLQLFPSPKNSHKEVIGN